MARSSHQDQVYDIHGYRHDGEDEERKAIEALIEALNNFPHSAQLHPSIFWKVGGRNKKRYDVVLSAHKRLSRLLDEFNYGKRREARIKDVRALVKAKQASGHPTSEIVGYLEAVQRWHGITLDDLRIKLSTDEIAYLTARKITKDI